MSNIAFNFLSDSFLFYEAENQYKERNLEEIEKELDNYKNYIQNNLDDLKKEIKQDYNFIQPLTQRSCLPSMSDLLQGSIFLDSYVIDDPIFSFNPKQILLANFERESMGMKEVSVEDIKEELSKKALYMKSLTSGVNCQVGYIKFYPLSSLIHTKFQPCITIPDLEIDFIDQNVYQWFKDRIIIQNMEKNRTNPKLDISNRVAISFKDDEGCNFYHYQIMIPEKKEGNTVTFRFDGNYIPGKAEYDNWVNQEIVKTIKSKIIFFINREQICSFFNSPVCLTNTFSSDFYKTNFNPTKANVHNLGFDLDIPGLQNISFDKAMEIRNTAHLSFVALQKKIAEDSKSLRTANDEKNYNEILRDIENEYKKGIESTNTVLSSMKRLFSPNNLFNMGLAVNSYFTGSNTEITTGLTILNGLYNAYDIVKNEISNPMYFLKKMAK